MIQITSVSNELIKEIAALKQKKYRNETGLFVIEGFKAVEEALEFGLEIKNIFIQKNFSKKLSNFSNDKIIQVTEPVMKKISSTETPPEILAIAKQIKTSISDILSKNGRLIILLENIKDAGNLGTIIRTGVAADIAGIILAGDTTDVYNPKTIRASVGNLWKLPIVHLKDKNDVKCLFKDYKIYSTIVKCNNSPQNYTNINYNDKILVMFGSESEGLSEHFVKQSDFSINIPMANSVESLNLSISAGIIMYEAYKQRLSN